MGQPAGRCGGCGQELSAHTSWCPRCYLPAAAAVPTAGVTVALPPALGMPPRPDPGAGPRPAPAVSGVGAPRHQLAGPVALVAGAIVFGLVVLEALTLLGDGGRTEPAALIRYALVATVVLYAAVSVAVVRYLALTGRRLRWHDGSPVTGAVVGAATGLTLAVVLLGIVRAATGQASGDPRIALLVSEGGIDHVAVAVLVAVIAAPLVEETLFRGLLAESLRGKGRGPAVVGSALAFSAWHLQPAALRYYLAVGALLGLLYYTRGLVCSTAAHAAFNGLLTLAAVLTTVAPGPSVAAGDLLLHAPHGWRQLSVPAADVHDGVMLGGPAASSVTVTHQPASVLPSTQAILARIAAVAAAMPPGVVLRADTARIERLPLGDAVRAELTADGHAGVLVVLPYRGELYELLLASSGSVRAEGDFDRMLQDLAG